MNMYEFVAEIFSYKYDINKPFKQRRRKKRNLTNIISHYFSHEQPLNQFLTRMIIIIIFQQKQSFLLRGLLTYQVSYGIYGIHNYMINIVK